MDPLAALFALLRPRVLAPKVVSGTGRWGAQQGRTADVGFGLVLEGQGRLLLTDGPLLQLALGDLVVLPPGAGFRLTGAADFRLLGGYCRCEPSHLALLAGLIPSPLHIRVADGSAPRLARVFALIADEATGTRPGRELVVEHLIEALLVEAVRFRPTQPGIDPRPGLLAGLKDPALARALTKLHGDVAYPWTVALLAREAALSRSVFSARFTRTLGLPPMQYLLQWRMAIARDLLQREDPPLERVAAAIGYESASAFSTAFRRRMGMPPGRLDRRASAGA